MPSAEAEKVRVVILAAGYGTRLQRDLEKTDVPKYTALKGVPKPLLPIGGTPLISRWVDKLAETNLVSTIHVVTNALTHHMFESWAQAYPSVTLHCDGSTSNEVPAVMNLTSSHYHLLGFTFAAGGHVLAMPPLRFPFRPPLVPLFFSLLSPSLSNTLLHPLRAFAYMRLTYGLILYFQTRSGAVAALHLVLQEVGFEESTVVVGGDTLFLDDFDLASAISQFSRNRRVNSAASLVLGYTVSEERVQKVGILDVDAATSKVVSFLEKPSPTDTPSRLACPCFYILSPAATKEIGLFLEKTRGKGLPLEKYDAPGNFIAHLIGNPQLPVHCYPISGRYDVGNLDTYITCDEAFWEKRGANAHWKLVAFFSAAVFLAFRAKS